ncbi:ribosomal L1 domain-containing protein 1-like [Ostrea edulis]|uniref:ribosomal L1 domain-containing protein 1-like n=1 Tax=Ostrea edulis TaxID=37623 RepID=UPI0024AF583B|nr:ribosomal L1 domain-containing protein 1-like [Ostrea edulis]
MESKRLEISEPEVQKAVAGLLKLSKVSDKKSDILQDRQKIQLVIIMKKIPNLPELTIKMNLPHGLFTPDTDVCLFVKDIDKTSREFELTEDHFRDLLMDKGVNCVRKVIPVKALKLEYKPYEAKRNLSNEFDIFLADERIARLLPSLLGKNFYGRKRNPIQVNLEVKNLKEEISKAVNNTRCVLKNKGSSSMVTIGHSEQTKDQIVENILKAVDQLAQKFPGGPDNIRSLHIKTESSMSIPFYMTVDAGDSVVFPERQKKKNTSITEEITTVMNAKVRVTADGQVKIVKSGVQKNKRRKRKSSGNKDTKSGAKKDGTADGEEVKIKVEYDSQEEEPIVKKAKTPKKEMVVTPGGSKSQKKTPKSGIRRGIDSVKRETDTPKISQAPNENVQTMQTPASVMKSKSKTPKSLKMDKTPKSVNKEKRLQGKTPKSATMEKAAKKLKEITPPKVKRLQSNVKVLTPDTPARKQKKN